mgnify:FL=1
MFNLLFLRKQEFCESIFEFSVMQYRIKCKMRVKEHHSGLRLIKNFKYVSKSGYMLLNRFRYLAKIQKVHQKILLCITKWVVVFMIFLDSNFMV